MGLGIRAAVCGSFLYGLTVAANAAVVPTFTVTPTAINAGDQSTLNLVLNLTADPGYFNAVFTGGSVTLFSDFGPSQIFNITAGGIAKSFSYVLHVSGRQLQSCLLLRCELFGAVPAVATDRGVLGHIRGFTAILVADSLSTCSEWIDTSYFQPLFGYVTYTTYTGNTGSGSLALTAVNPVPLPAALPLFATVLAGGGLIAWRRKRKAAKLAA